MYCDSHVTPDIIIHPLAHPQPPRAAEHILLLTEHLETFGRTWIEYIQLLALWSTFPHHRIFQDYWFDFRMVSIMFLLASTCPYCILPYAPFILHSEYVPDETCILYLYPY